MKSSEIGDIKCYFKRGSIKNKQKIKIMKPTVQLTILKEDVGYGATGKCQDRFMATCGDTWEELQRLIVDMVNLTFEDLGYTYTLDEIQLEYDLESFFDFYRIINAKALSQRIGMNQSLLAQYINGAKKPSAKQMQRIVSGIQQVGRELSEVALV